MRAYVLGVICAAFALSILSALAPDGPGKGVRRLAGSIFLTLAVLAPLGNAELPRLDLDRLKSDALRASLDGIRQAEEAEAECISQALEAYILTKAAELGLSPRVRVELDRAGLPTGVTLTGEEAPQLTEVIARALGLEKEAVTWNISYQSSE